METGFVQPPSTAPISTPQKRAASFLAGSIIEPLWLAAGAGTAAPKTGGKKKRPTKKKSKHCVSIIKKNCATAASPKCTGARPRGRKKKK